MHDGPNAESGHYYSYIKVNDKKWLEFNDSQVKEFDPDTIASVCFGGNNNNNNKNNNNNNI